MAKSSVSAFLDCHNCWGTCLPSGCQCRWFQCHHRSRGAVRSQAGAGAPSWLFPQRLGPGRPGREVGRSSCCFRTFFKPTAVCRTELWVGVLVWGVKVLILEIMYDMMHKGGCRCGSNRIALV